VSEGKASNLHQYDSLKSHLFNWDTQYIFFKENRMYPRRVFYSTYDMTPTQKGIDKDGLRSSGWSIGSWIVLDSLSQKRRRRRGEDIVIKSECDAHSMRHSRLIHSL